MKVALVCDWLTNVGGAEKVLLEIHKMFPDAPIYTSQYDPSKIDWFRDADVRTGSMQKYPAKLRKLLGPLRQRYFAKLDLSEYDLVISVTGAEAKAVKVPNGLHISYCHVPTQYYWHMYEDYIKNPGFGILNPLVRLCFRMAVRPLRRADRKAAKKVDYFVTISEYAKDLIKKYYERDAVVIHPPVEVDEFRTDVDREGTNSYFITTSRQVNWKRIDLAVKACLMTQRKLVVIGEGPEHKKLVKLAKDSGLVKFLPVMKKEKLAKYITEARGFLFPSLEPFGIAPVEALAAGCPVIAFGEGGALDYIVNGKNGLLFEKQDTKSLAAAILEFDKLKFNREKVSKTADKFSEKRFNTELSNFVKKCEKKNGKEKAKA